MKERKAIITCIALILMFIFCQSEQTAAKKKMIEIPLKQEWANKTKEFSYETVTIETGKTYTLKELIKPFSDYNSIVYDLNNKLNKGSKITISGKELLVNKKSISGKKPLVNKKTIRANDTGDYWLKVTLRDSVHLFRVKSVEKYFSVPVNEVAKIIITQYDKHWDGKPIRVEITDPIQIRQIVSRLMKPRYAFSFARLRNDLPCSNGYYLGLYAEDGRCLAWQIMESYGMVEVKYVRKAENSSEAKECYDYIYKLYKDLLAQVPKRSWE